jgi:hypothetical protein
MARKSVRSSNQKSPRRNKKPLAIEQLAKELSRENESKQTRENQFAVGRLASAQWVEDFKAAFDYVSADVILRPRKNPHVSYLSGGELLKLPSIKRQTTFEGRVESSERFIDSLVVNSEATMSRARSELEPDFLRLFLRQRSNGTHNIAAEIKDIPVQDPQAGFIIRGERLTITTAVIEGRQALRQVSETTGGQVPTHRIWLGNIALADKTEREFQESMSEMAGYLPPAVPLQRVSPIRTD